MGTIASSVLKLSSSYTDPYLLAEFSRIGAPTNTFFNALSNGHSVKGENKYPEIMGKIASSVLKLSSSYTNPYLLAEFSRIGGSLNGAGMAE